MCGFITFISNWGHAEGRQPIATALEQMHHRGPDETGIEVVGSDVAFAHKRLAIIDVDSSHEPMSYPPGGADAGRYLLAFNGEIYNYIELRKELAEQFDAQFATAGDAEVILAGYHYWGEQVLERLRGMFAFVIWDATKRAAFAARDHFGIKPLHFMHTADGLYFASEKKALLQLLPADADPHDAGLDTASVSHYLTLQYVPEPATLHTQIKRIQSGECLTFAPGGEVSTRRYYQPMFRPAPVTDAPALYRRIRKTLTDSVRIHMRSDVPVGAFLSSGIDSTAVVALAREFNPDILTFTVGYDVPGYSEIDVAQESARHLGVTTIPTVIGPDEMMSALPTIVWHLDDPVADPATVPLYFVAKKAAEHVTVVLSGEGADEFFGGYTIYREPMSLAPLQRLPAAVQKGLRGIARMIPQTVRGKSFLERGTTPIEERYYGNARMFTDRDKQRLLRHYDPSVRHTDITAPIYAEAADLDDVTSMQYVDLLTWLRGDILVKADRMSMAHSLELRVPFLDRAVFDVAATLPVNLKLPPHSIETKFALRRALETVVPPAIVNRKKLGFPTPTRVWLAGPMYEWAHDILSRSGASDLLDLGYVRGLLDAHKQGQADYSRKIWTVLVFCVWYAIFVERSLQPEPVRAKSALLSKPVVGSKVW
jgi:asparagine synthase (glutamine-hydrolysing)